MAINLLECTESTDGTKTTLDDTLRVMVFENDLDDSYEKVYHDTVVYAKESATANTNIEGKKTKREFVSTPAFQEDEDHPLATSFESLKTIVTYDRGDFDLGQARRYTLVTWLEGEDPDSPNDRAAPVGATLRLGVEITAYENENE